MYTIGGKTLIFSEYEWQHKIEEQASEEAQIQRQDKKNQLVLGRRYLWKLNEKVCIKKMKNIRYISLIQVPDMSSKSSSYLKHLF